MNSFRALQHQINQIDDPEIRARLRREWGLVGLDDEGSPGPLGRDRSGPEAALNNAVVGRDWTEFYAGDQKMVAAEELAQISALTEEQRRRRYLSKEDVCELFDATSFVVQETGKPWNAQITIAYASLGIVEHQAAAKLLSDFLREFGDRLRDWGDLFNYVYVHENSVERGFHTHLVTTIPVGLRPKVKHWSEQFFGRRSNGPFPVDAVKVQISGVRSPQHRLKLHQHRLLYICKGLDPHIMDRGGDGQLRPLIELMGVPEKFRRAAGAIECSKRCGVSHSLGRKVRGQWPQAKPSALSARNWSELNTGWELAEHVERQRERELFSVLNKMRI